MLAAGHLPKDVRERPEPHKERNKSVDAVEHEVTIGSYRRYDHVAIFVLDEGRQIVDEQESACTDEGPNHDPQSFYSLNLLLLRLLLEFGLRRRLRHHLLNDTSQNNEEDAEHICSDTQRKELKIMAEFLRGFDVCEKLHTYEHTKREYPEEVDYRKYAQESRQS